MTSTNHCPIPMSHGFASMGVWGVGGFRISLEASVEFCTSLSHDSFTPSDGESDLGFNTTVKV